jgi:agmatine/peptidylarginine deiminase
MKEHLAQTKTLFEAQGFELVSLTNPMPSAILNLDSYRNAKGDVVHQEVRLTFVHRSYANSLIANGQLYLPTYQEFPELNQAAHDVYQKLGFKVHDIDMTETIKRGGAVHCLTKDLH